MTPAERDGGPAAVEVSAAYLHVPFCARRCRYCDFAIHIDRAPSLADWAETVGAEWRLALEDPTLAIESPLSSLYVGGGTPSLLGPELASAVGRIIGQDHLPLEGGEWTVEVNPESFSRDTAVAWRGAGVSRVSIGIQSFHEPSLRWMARLHRAEGAIEAVYNARSAGLNEISLDLIFGLPAHLERSWTTDLDQALALEVPHVSLYGLTVEQGTPLAKAIASGRERHVPGDVYESEYLEAVRRLTAAGYEHYEVSNFARPGHRARHNPLYWSREPYLGLGNGAHSFIPPRRRWNVHGWSDYRARIHSGATPLESEEIVTGDAELLERVWLGLRAAEGLDMASLEEASDQRSAAAVSELLATWSGRGLKDDSSDRVRLTAKGWLVLDALSVDLSDCLSTSSYDHEVVSGAG